MMLQKLIDQYLRAFENHPVHHNLGSDAYLKSKKEYFRCRDLLKEAGIDPQEVSRMTTGPVRHVNGSVEDLGDGR